MYYLMELLFAYCSSSDHVLQQLEGHACHRELVAERAHLDLERCEPILHAISVWTRAQHYRYVSLGSRQERPRTG